MPVISFTFYLVGRHFGQPWTCSVCGWPNTLLNLRETCPSQFWHVGIVGETQPGMLCNEPSNEFKNPLPPPVSESTLYGSSVFATEASGAPYILGALTVTNAE